MARTYSNLARDASNAVIQAGNSFQTSDATASPNTSPLSYTGSVTTLVVPINALELVLTPSTALRISELVAMGTYNVISAGTTMAFGVAGMSKVYIKQDSANGTLQFYFVIV